MSQVTEFEVKSIKDAKIGCHLGIYTKSYQEERALYDSRNKNWLIRIADDHFEIEDTNKEINNVTCYEQGTIFNCSCQYFVENQSGTCQHIETIKRCHYQIGSITSRSNFLNFDLLPEPIVKMNGVDNQAVINYKKYLANKSIGYNTNQYKSLNVINGISLFPYQEESILKMIRNKRTVLTLKMGLGKTLCALACTKILDAKKVIVICPNSIKAQWEIEINKHKIGDAITLFKENDIDDYYYDEKDYKVVIVNYEFLNFHPCILDDKFDIAIIDEIQRIKNKESLTWKVTSKVKSDYVFALSGTVIQNNISDLMSVINVLNPAEFTPEWRFYQEYCDTTKAKIFGFKEGAYKRLEEKFSRYIINPEIDMSKMKLPSTNNVNIKVDLNQEQLKLSNNYFNQAQILLAKSINNQLTYQEKMRLNGLLTKARMSAIDARLIDLSSEKSSRLDVIEQKILTIVSSGEKLMVYSDWVLSLSLLHKFLNDNSIKFVEFNGKVNAKKRDKYLREFIDDNSIMVFLSTDAGGVGIDGLQGVCNNILHMEPTWNPAKISQRNGRIVRIFQKKPIVNIFNVISNANVEKLILDGNIRKNALFKEVFG